ncbi:MAG: rhamnulokinase [Solirubrobacterales bacterium]|nr:rhamnulokinase [Solirubrobacterales bacterium]
MNRGRAFAAVDLGAESGRVALGRFDGEKVSLDIVHRFANHPVWLNDGLHWNLLKLFDESLSGIARAADAGRLDGIGVDAWGVDYALLDATDRVLGLPFHYRDRRTEEMIAAADAKIGREVLYARTGIQTMPINTIFQLLSEADGAAARAAARLAFVPDLFGLWMTGQLVNEVTIASTSGLLGAEDGRWARDLIARLGLPEAPFTHDPVEPGTGIGPLLAQHDDACGDAARAKVWTVAGHDTASAFVAIPLTGPRDALLSSGTWSLLGIESDRPFLDARAREYNLTNERGVGGRIRLLRNVMGLWLLQECRRAWKRTGVTADYEQLMALAESADPNVALFDPDEEVLLTPGEMPARISEACRVAGQSPPSELGEIVRSILTSLACKYRFVLERLQRLTGQTLEVLHVVGGGARNRLLCQLTADLTGLPVSAGPVEATALGNVLVQAIATGEVADLSQARQLSAASWERTVHEPQAAAQATELYDRFLTVTGLLATDRDHAIAQQGR